MELRAAFSVATAAVYGDQLGYSYHGAVEKMTELSLAEEDICCALLLADEGEPQTLDATKWKFWGPTLSGVILAVVLRFHDDGRVHVITIHPYP